MRKYISLHSFSSSVDLHIKSIISCAWAGFLEILFNIIQKGSASFESLFKISENDVFKMSFYQYYYNIDILLSPWSTKSCFIVSIKQTEPFSQAEILIKHNAASLAITSDGSLVNFNKASKSSFNDVIKDNPSGDPVKPGNTNKWYIS